MKIKTVLIEIFLKSFPGALNLFIRRFKSLFIWFFGSAGSFFSIQTNVVSHPLLNWIPFTTNTYINFTIILGLLFIAVFVYYQVKFFLVESWQKYILISGESVYGNAIVILSNAYSTINSNRNKKLELNEVKVILQSFCDSVREIYEYKTKSTCNVSIKVIVDFKSADNVVNFQTEVKNLVRDKKCQNRDNPNYESIKHRIANNTCYQRIMANYFANKHSKLYFLSNDLPSLEDYQNSSMEQFLDFDETIKSDEKSRRKKWPLDYKSELVVGLSPMFPKMQDELPIIGFLCIDCELNKKEIFSTIYDVPLVRGIADGLYEFIKFNLFKEPIKP